jgi:hypothetical protein
MSTNRKKDLGTQDWLLLSTEKMIKKINTNIATEIYKTSGGNYLVAKNVSSTDLRNLTFITNNDTNNNFLTLKELKVCINNETIPNIIPGFMDIANEIFRYSDNNAFINGEKTYKPFISIEDTLNKYTSLVPFLPKTTGITKKYFIVLSVSE